MFKNFKKNGIEASPGAQSKESSSNLNLSPRDEQDVFVDPDHNAAHGVGFPVREV